MLHSPCLHVFTHTHTHTHTLSLSLSLSVTHTPRHATLVHSAIGKLFASAGDTQLACMCHVPKALSEKLTLKEWVETVCSAVKGEIVEMGEEFAKFKVGAWSCRVEGAGRWSGPPEQLTSAWL